MKYETIVCDRCGKEKKRESSDSWIGWHEAASVGAQGIVTPYSGMPDFKWRGDLCRQCSECVDDAMRGLFVKQK